MQTLFNIINIPFGWALEFLSSLFGGNFAAAVFFFTLLINVILIPLSIKSQKSSVQQTRIKPKLDELKKKYGDDKQKYSEAMQKLYQEENVSMSGGCLPMVLRLVLMMSIYYLIMSPLTYLLHIDSATVTAAAEALYLAQSTVSGHILSLEKDIGVPLLVRSGKRRITLTEEGRRVYDHAHTILQSCAELSRELEEQTSREVSLAASSIPMQYILPQLISEFHRENPDFRFLLRSGDSAAVHAAITRMRRFVRFLLSSGFIGCTSFAFSVILPILMLMAFVGQTSTHDAQWLSLIHISEPTRRS